MEIGHDISQWYVPRTQRKEECEQYNKSRAYVWSSWRKLYHLELSSQITTGTVTSEKFGEKHPGDDWKVT